MYINNDKKRENNRIKVNFSKKEIDPHVIHLSNLCMDLKEKLSK